MSPFVVKPFHEVTTFGDDSGGKAQQGALTPIQNQQQPIFPNPGDAGPVR
jgi:hypothetical protein